MNKYQITSATNVMTMIITFNKGSESINVRVGVDYLNERVFFEGTPSPDIDYEDLEQEILAHLRPDLIPQPVISPEMLQRIKDVKLGNYGTDIPKHGEQ